jgi:hypothetical protein
MMEAKKITVRPAGRSYMEEVPVTRTIVTRTPARSVDYEIQREEVTVLPGHWTDPDSPDALDYWTERLGPSIVKMLPSREHEFRPMAVSVEREEFFRDGFPEESLTYAATGIPRRVKVRRQRVTLFGTVARIR